MALTDPAPEFQIRRASRADAEAIHRCLVAAFDPNGRFLRVVAAGGALNAPWGVALAQTPPPPSAKPTKR